MSDNWATLSAREKIEWLYRNIRKLKAYVEGISVGGGGTGDVTAASNFSTDNRIIRSDGTAKGVQASPVTLNDTGDISGVRNLQVTGHSYADEEVDNGNSGAAKTIDWTTGNFQEIVLTADCTLTFTAPSGPTTLVLKVTQDGSGGWDFTYPGTTKWADSTEPVLTGTAGSVDILTFYYDGTNYHGGTFVLNSQT